jgi:hypothetical protein
LESIAKHQSRYRGSIQLKALGQHLASHCRWQSHSRIRPVLLDYGLLHEGNGRITTRQGAAGGGGLAQRPFTALQVRVDLQEPLLLELGALAGSRRATPNPQAAARCNRKDQGGHKHLSKIHWPRLRNCNTRPDAGSKATANERPKALSRRRSRTWTDPGAANNH